jgi:hypothetical protein
MSKKKQTDEPPKLTPVQYWEWRTTIAEMNEAKAKLELNEARLKIMGKQVELEQAKAQLFGHTQLRVAKEAHEEARSEYFRFKKTLEESLGVSLDGKVIDDLSFEVKSLPKDI